jgi:protein CpxP
MILELDLSTKQQEQLKPIIAEENRKRESRMKEMKASKEANSKLSSDERFSRKSQMLDEQVDLKVKIKTILSVDQFEKWDAIK